MNSDPKGIADALAGAWRAIARAFRPASEARGALNEGADTTLFGGPEPPVTGRGRATRNDVWEQAAASTDFADPDPTRDARRR